MFYFSDYAKTVDKDHDRIEIRECWTLDASFFGTSIRNMDKWAKVKTVVMIRRERKLAKKTEVHTRYYIASLAGKAERFFRSFGTNGALKTLFIGSWIWTSMKISRAYTKITVRKT